MNFKFKKYYFIVISDTVVKNLGKLISLGSNAMAITIFPFIFVRKNTYNNKELLRHETIHIRQQIEFLFVGILVLHLYEYFYAKYIKKLSSRQSYYYTSMEQEAHRNAMNENYLYTRKPYSMVKYIWDKKKLSRGKEGELIVEKY